MFFCSDCWLHYIQNVWFELTALTQTRFWNICTVDSKLSNRSKRNIFLLAKPNHQLLTHFVPYLGIRWKIFNNNFCVEIVCSSQMFWIQWNLQNVTNKSFTFNQQSKSDLSLITKFTLAELAIQSDSDRIHNNYTTTQPGKYKTGRIPAIGTF